MNNDKCNKLAKIVFDIGPYYQGIVIIEDHRDFIDFIRYCNDNYPINLSKVVVDMMSKGVSLNDRDTNLKFITHKDIKDSKIYGLRINCAFLVSPVCWDHMSLIFARLRHTSPDGRKFVELI